VFDNTVPTYVMKMQTTPGMVAWWIERCRATGARAVVVLGHGVHTIDAAHKGLMRAGTVIAYDADGATRPFHPVLKVTDRGNFHRSDRIPFRLEVLIRPEIELIDPAGSTTAGLGVIEDPEGRGVTFFYGLPIPAMA
jgi:hypothetical protein